MSAPGLVKEIAKKIKSFDEMPRPIDKVIPPLSMQQERVNPLVVNGKPMVFQPSITIHNAEPGYIEIILVGIGGIFVGLFFSGILK